MTSAKKYKLFSNQGEGEEKPCAFFMSDKGCRNGANCKFAHVAANSVEKETDRTQEAKAIIETGSVVSSESEDEKDAPVFMAPGESGESGKKRKKARRGQNGDSASPFAKPKKAKTTTPTPPATEPTPVSATKKAKAVKEEKIVVKQEKESEQATPSFRALNLPVASFSLGSASSNARNLEKKKPTPPPEPEPPRYTPLTAPLPKHTPTGLKWLKTVEKTRQHLKYEAEFDYDKYIDADQPLGGKNIWVKPKPFGDWCKNNPQAIAIDCEMCQTKDPETGNVDNRALCRISVVDVETDEVLLDSLVKPDWPVSDYRSRINGIKEEHLKDVEFTLRHAQAFMVALCSDETIIMGHSVNNDLAAIRMEHYCIVDSAFLFKCAENETATIGLKDLCYSILKKEMPNTHDSVNDARVALRCLEHYLEKDGQVDPVERAPRSQKNEAASQLFVHRIPKSVKKEHLKEVFLQHTSVAAESADEIEFTGDSGRTHIHFKTPRHANLAFASLESKPEMEASGRLQKKLYIRGGGYIRVRKMVKEREHKTEHKTEA